MKNHFLFGYFFLFCISSLRGQDRYQLGVIPQINNEFSLGDRYELNSKVEIRQLLKDGPSNLTAQKGFHFERSDFETILNRKLSPLDGVGVGYLLRIEEGKLVHRFIQQYAHVQNKIGFRLAHRFRSDQTITDNEWSFRIRYRLSFEKPLEGLEIDPKEFYLKINNEYLPTYAKKELDVEIRLLASLGYNLSDKMKFETGFDYRAEDIIAKNTEHQCWLNLGWFHSF
ncbi:MULTISPECIES: DUF2490 domain-containing protein [Olivibacter]|jgi:hypothetical protein|uniref:DUF2490 domain-containing protein n=2 Tax=Olivibacter TaxID=376469 RepID=A0ABV6HKT5_9SPHI|nr:MULTISPECIES: DUF2490 domain-containing protein [Olivibacter]MCL4637423.1 DUF2490 domain-containing protein [Olivibacter sp. UJ_SKK_5.1]MDM8175517.1 DUF2490 domain-containing protein [Olivibacter sp. 47]MDX3914126.1 DUF2490 domain-containing protein [Pseudosphingobacterium sp.]QEL02268.1 DUF2490 domain-containing protein [Olivibacter sp. LS-1]